MKLGDMVTLSTAALKRETLWLWADKLRDGGSCSKLLGVVTEIKPDSTIGFPGKKQDVFVIHWISGDAPKHREGDSLPYSWMAHRHANQFYRRDLKFVSRRKPKQK